MWKLLAELSWGWCGCIKFGPVTTFQRSEMRAFSNPHLCQLTSEDFSLLVTFLLVTFSWLFRGFFRGFSVAFSLPSSAWKNSVWAFFMVFPWFFRGFLVAFSWLFRGFFVAFSWLFRGPVLGKFYAYSPWKSLLMTIDTGEGCFAQPSCQ